MADAWRQGIVDAAAANGLPVEAVKRELADLDGSEASLQQVGTSSRPPSQPPIGTPAHCRGCADAA